MPTVPNKFLLASTSHNPTTISHIQIPRMTLPSNTFILCWISFRWDKVLHSVESNSFLMPMLSRFQTNSWISYELHKKIIVMEVSFALDTLNINITVHVSLICPLPDQTWIRFFRWAYEHTSKQTKLLGWEGKLEHEWTVFSRKNDFFQNFVPEWFLSWIWFHVL